MNSVRSNYKSLKYQSFTPPGCKVKGIRNFGFVGKTSLPAAINQKIELIIKVIFWQTFPLMKGRFRAEVNTW